MGQDIIHRPDWLPAASASETIAGGAMAMSGDWGTPAVADVPADLSPALAAKWAEAGGVAHHLGTAQAAARNVLAGIDEADDLVAAFDELPESARTAIIGELAAGTWGSIRPASQTEIDRFSQDEDGAVLVSSWGSNAPRRVAAGRARLKRIFGNMRASDAETAATWFGELPAAAAQAILRELAR